MAQKRKATQAEQATDSESYRKAKNKAQEYVDDPDKLKELIEKATSKADGKKGPLDAVRAQLAACLRLFKAYAAGTYREIPWQSLLMLIASIVYFVMPVDLIPDFILGLGLLDDAAVLGWTFKTFSADLDAFVAWEATQPA